MKKYLLIILVFLCCHISASAEESVIMKALEVEMNRSMKELKLEDKEKPYYISYLVKDAYQLNITADSGAITVNSGEHSRSITVDLRIGDYNMDNSNFISLSSRNSSTRLTMPMVQDNNYDMIRMAAWIAADNAYKAAIDKLAKKKVARQNLVEAEELPDFIKGSANSSIKSEESFSVDRDKLAAKIDELSRIFIKQPLIQKSKVSLDVKIINSYYINTEGAKSIEPAEICQLMVTATTQADDGMPVGNILLYTTADHNKLPELQKLKKDVSGMIDELIALRQAPVAEDYSGPVLFVDQAAGELFNQGFSGYLAGRRVPMADNPQLNAAISMSIKNPFVSKIDRRVAARFLSMKAEPGLKEYNGKSLPGSYYTDEEGVPAQDVQLIEDGKLINLLTGRTPLKGFNTSNGHSRGGWPVPGVIRITSSEKLSSDELKQELLNAVSDEGLPYGYMVKGLTPPFAAVEMNGTDIIMSLLMQQQGAADPTQFNLSRPYSIYRVYPDGKEELVRGAEFRSHSINILKDILATSDEETVYSYPVTPGGSSGISSIVALLSSSSGGSQYYSSVIIPSLLISEMDIKKVSGNFNKLPIVDYPIK